MSENLGIVQNNKENLKQTQIVMTKHMRENL